MALRDFTNGKTLGRLLHQQVDCRRLRCLISPTIMAHSNRRLAERLCSFIIRKHHQTYITKYNKALEQLDDAIAKGDASTAVKLQSAIKFNGGGHVNHSIFWKNLAPTREGGGVPPHGSLGWAIDQHFGSMKKLIAKMNAEGAIVQGSGWVWLAVDKELKRLVVEITANQERKRLKVVIKLPSHTL